MKIKHLTILLLAAIFFFACKKAPEIPVATVQLSDEVITPYTRAVKITSKYSYPSELDAVTVYVSENNDMSGAVSQKATMTSSTISAEIIGLEALTSYNFYFEYKIGSSSSKSSLKTFKTLDYSKPTVTTSEVTEITATSAKCGGEVIDDGDLEVTARGICWSTSQNPTTSDSHTSDGTETGSFTSSLTNLEVGIKYYVRAYATNSKGTSYGEEKNFTTRDGTIILTTNEVTNIAETTATCGGNITDDGGFIVTARGICWSTSPNPDLSDNTVLGGDGMGSYTCNITGLTLGVTYYVKAYATNNKGTEYGDQKVFTTKLAGAISGLFSVSSTKQVYFSQGNLQYQASTNTWRFAEHQYDYIGEANSNISSYYSGWIDLFGWGTSGWNCGNTYYRPYDSNSSDGSLYGPSGSNNLTGTYARSDWGVYNAISNGGNQSGQWRTLTGGPSGEWGYLWNTRVKAANKRGWACVNGINGIVILPDSWTQPSGFSFTPNSSGFTTNTYTTLDWTKMEDAGAVFLPAAGDRNGTSLNFVGSYGLYWSSSCSSSYSAYHPYFYRDLVFPDGTNGRYYGFSVRLVQDLLKAE